MRHSVYILLFIALSGCTIALWLPNESFVKVGGFYVVENENKLIAAGKRHNYIFKIDEEYLEVLKLSRSIEFRPSFFDFRFKGEGKIAGKVKLSKKRETIKKQDDINALKRLGFTEDKTEYIKILSLNGHVYQSKREFDNYVRFDSPYIITVRRPKSIEDIALSAAYTPLAVQFDIAAMIVAGTMYTVIVVDHVVNN